MSIQHLILIKCMSCLFGCSMSLGWWRSFTVLDTNVASFPLLMWEVAFTACVISLFIYSWLVSWPGEGYGLAAPSASYQGQAFYHFFLFAVYSTILFCFASLFSLYFPTLQTFEIPHRVTAVTDIKGVLLLLFQRML